jgi:uroporphyrinogen-III synthase
MTILERLALVDPVGRSPQDCGLHALVTRPHQEAAALSEALTARGIEPIIEPLLDIRYRSGAAPELSGVQALLCTSANGVRAFARLSPERGVPLLAVGEATAARARDAGFLRVENAAGNVTDLARLARQLLRPAAGRLLHIAGSSVAGDLSAELRDHSFTVERAVLYDAIPADRLSEAATRAFAAGMIDFALFFSPRTATIFARLARQADLTGTLSVVTAISISAAADQALDDLRFRQRLVALHPGQAGLLAVLDQAMTERHA